MRNVTAILAVAVVLGAVGICRAQADDPTDWPRFRGADGVGISAETDWNPAAVNDKAKVLWSVNVGEGYSSVAVVGDRVYTMGNEKDKDFVGCLDIDSGKVVWRYPYPCKSGEYPGPRVTPTVDGDRVYTLSREGHLFCLDAANGTVKWQRHLVSELKAQNIGWGFSGSPIVDGEMLIVNAGKHGMAFDKKSGKTVWESPRGKCGYATPVVFQIGERRCVAIFGQEALYAVDITNGRKIWSYPWETDHDINAADPIVSGSRVFISSGYGHGCALVDFSSGKPRLVWQNKAMKNHFSSCILINGYIYGIDGSAGKGDLKCLEGRSGETRWSHKTGFGGLVAAGGKLVVLNERGKLFVVEATPEGYRQISAGTAMNPRAAKCWTAPVLAKGRIFCRSSNGQLVCVDVRQ